MINVYELHEIDAAEAEVYINTVLTHDDLDEDDRACMNYILGCVDWFVESYNDLFAEGGYIDDGYHSYGFGYEGNIVKHVYFEKLRRFRVRNEMLNKLVAM